MLKVTLPKCFSDKHIRCILKWTPNRQAIFCWRTYRMFQLVDYWCVQHHRWQAAQVISANMSITVLMRCMDTPTFTTVATFTSFKAWCSVSNAFQQRIVYTWDSPIVPQRCTNAVIIVRQHLLHTMQATGNIRRAHRTHHKLTVQNFIGNYFRHLSQKQCQLPCSTYIVDAHERGHKMLISGWLRSADLQASVIRFACPATLFARHTNSLSSGTMVWAGHWSRHLPHHRHSGRNAGASVPTNRIKCNNFAVGASSKSCALPCPRIGRLCTSTSPFSTPKANSVIICPIEGTLISLELISRCGLHRSRHTIDECQLRHGKTPIPRRSGWSNRITGADSVRGARMTMSFGQKHSNSSDG